MFPPFDQEQANLYCRKLISLIQSGDLELRQVSLESEERKNQGIMIGSLVCKKENQTVILACVSGISKELFYQNQKSFTLDNNQFIIVPSIADNQQIQQALKQNDGQIHELTDKINSLSLSPDEKIKLTNLRQALCDQSLKNVFNLYSFHTAQKKKISLNQIIEEKHKLPPTGTGECCAPKLLSYAFENNLIPLSMDEVYFGQDTKNRENGKSYAPCDNRCGFILPSILGLEILYRDNDIIVVNKTSGLLSVPGRTEDKQDCVVSRVKTLFPDCIEQPSVHRLDMETSGLLVLAFTKDSHRELNRQFAEGLVEKEYIAILDGVLQTAPGNLTPKKGEKSGRIELKFRLDVENRPHQIYDEEYGKLGITDWEYLETFTWENPVTKEKKAVTKVRYVPQTGRTHQLRLVSSDMHGFGLPIIGDTLYGKCREGERLMLHSCKLEFTHPVSGQRMKFYCPPEF